MQPTQSGPRKRGRSPDPEDNLPRKTRLNEGARALEDPSHDYDESGNDPHSAEATLPYRGLYSLTEAISIDRSEQFTQDESTQDEPKDLSGDEERYAKRTTENNGVDAKMENQSSKSISHMEKANTHSGLPGSTDLASFRNIQDRFPKSDHLEGYLLQRPTSSPFSATSSSQIPSQASRNLTTDHLSSSNVEPNHGPKDSSPENGDNLNWREEGSPFGVLERGSDRASENNLEDDGEKQDRVVNQRASVVNHSSGIRNRKKQHLQQSSTKVLSQMNEVNALTTKWRPHDYRNLLQSNKQFYGAATSLMRDDMEDDLFHRRIDSIGSNYGQWKHLMKKHPGMQKFFDRYQNEEHHLKDETEKKRSRKKNKFQVKASKLKKGYEILQEQMKEKSMGELSGEESEEETTEQRHFKNEGMAEWKESVN